MCACVCALLSASRGRQGSDRGGDSSAEQQTVRLRLWTVFNFNFLCLWIVDVLLHLGSKVAATEVAAFWGVALVASWGAACHGLRVLAARERCYCEVSPRILPLLPARPCSSLERRTVTVWPFLKFSSLSLFPVLASRTHVGFSCFLPRKRPLFPAGYVTDGRKSQFDYKPSVVAGFSGFFPHFWAVSSPDADQSAVVILPQESLRKHFISRRTGDLYTIYPALISDAVLLGSIALGWLVWKDLASPWTQEWKVGAECTWTVRTLVCDQKSCPDMDPVGRTVPFFCSKFIFFHFYWLGFHFLPFMLILPLAREN